MGKMFSKLVIAASVALSTLSSAQQLLRDPGVAGPPLEIVHLYNDQWPTGTSSATLSLQPEHH